ncbi:ankyrin repeat domain-containing protein [Azomonas macrocytogenes]|uniref:Rhodanese-related sulfurtransferase n=1 Tax=Azomonas macrocytogenes TaxID=69962 RepID=A0A839T3X5_AZOMA|nr:ankyrin repeat domain-containing protein [Azomonas macrocytogenes]MBB3103034.1 rhodanese-related sulfurtransferase [Azomonas macrocytogenes]
MAIADRTPYQCLSVTEAASLIRVEKDIKVFDVRDLQSYQQEHLDGAMHLTEDRLPLWLNRIEKDVPVLVYCYHGNSSKTFAQMFADFRFERVYSVDGGYRPLANALAEPVAGQEIRRGLVDTELEAFLKEWNFDPIELNAPREHGLTPLMRAALQGQREIARKLLDRGVNIQARNDDGNNALWLACVSRNEGLVQDLIDAGIELNNRNDASSTALMYTASSDRPELTRLLLEAGADPQVKNFDDMRAVDLAASVACLKLLRHTL